MRTVVIGGGVIGLTLAHRLLLAGEEVCVLDARPTGLGASTVNAGWIVPAEAAPVPGPGAVALTLRSMLHPDGPVYVHPSPDPAFLRFLLGMWRASTGARQRAGFEAHLRLAEDSLHWFDTYAGDGMDVELHDAGLLMTFTGQAPLDHHLANLDLARRFGREPRVLLGDDVRVHEPALSDAVLGGIFFPRERHVLPGTLCRALHARLVAGGAEVVENAPVEAVEPDPRDRGRVRGVRTPQKYYPADRFVLAAGAWSGPLSRAFGSPLPIRPGKGYSIELPPLALRGPTSLSDAKVAVTPFAHSLRLAGTMEFAGWDENVNPVRVAAILRAPATYFRDWVAPREPPVGRAGMRPMTPDGLPVIGRLPGLENAYVNSGHGMLGVTLSAGSADALTEAMLGRATPDVLKPFDPERFSRRPLSWLNAPPWICAASSSPSPRRSHPTGRVSTTS